MPFPMVPIWKKAPFLRLLIPLLAGIITQWYLHVSSTIWLSLLAIALFVFLVFFFLPLFHRYHLSSLHGLAASAIFTAGGAVLISQKDIRRETDWFGRSYKNQHLLRVALTEDPVTKARSYKANADVNYMAEAGRIHKVSGKIILYFARDSFPGQLDYGTQLILTKPLQEIKSTGNPGGFDYKRYCLFQGLTHQVYLTAKDFTILAGKKKSPLQSFINTSRKKVLDILRRYVPGEKEKGLAEALLIGYKDDLDKTLVQAYANTGVVHIIAVSGLHLGLIYWLLLQLLKPLQRGKYIRLIRPVVVISGLWVFSLLAGAQPSVLRSAVMFTCIVIGESIGRQTSIYNSLAASAFLLLCYNPYWAWDVGFQLSYAAVLSIVIFMRPVYNCLYSKNKVLDFAWKMNAVTIAAQVLTTPFSVFHFHQFPNFFLLTNFIAVPLSSLVLLGEIGLCIVSFMPALAEGIGNVLHKLIWLMNTWIEKVEALPFSVWGGLQINLTQTVLLLFVIGFASYWLLEKRKKGLLAALFALLGLVTLRSIDLAGTRQQKKIIVYNIPGRRAIDVIQGNTCLCICDSVLFQDNLTKTLHVTPSRILHRLREIAVIEYRSNENYLLCPGKKIMLLAGTINFPGDTTVRPEIDLLVLSGSPELYVPALADYLVIKRVVFDASVPFWKSRHCKKDCDSLQIPWHDVNEKGAFVMNLR